MEGGHKPCTVPGPLLSAIEAMVEGGGEDDGPRITAKLWTSDPSMVRR